MVTIVCWSALFPLLLFFLYFFQGGEDFFAEKTLLFAGSICIAGKPCYITQFRKVCFEIYYEP